MKTRYICFVVLLVLAIGGCRQGMSKAEAQETKQELLAMMRNAKPGDPNSIDFTVEPKTQFGKEFKAVLLKIKGVEDRIANEPAYKNMDKILSPERLTTAEGRAQSKADTERLRVVFAEYYQDSAEFTRELIDIATRAAGSEPKGASDIMDEVKQMAAKTDGLIDSMMSLVSYVETTKPSLNAGMLEFPTDAEVQKYNALYADFEKVAVEHDQFIANILQARGVKMRNAMQTLETAD